MTEGAQQTGSDKTAVRPFHVNVPEAELTELRRRINAARWPERETVTDDSQGVPLAMIQELARYWAADYDWRRCEAKLNALPHFMTEIDGLDIHFIHVRSDHDDALPLIVTHGWPGSVIEQLKIIGPLADPAAHGASASDAFHLVVRLVADNQNRLFWHVGLVGLLGAAFLSRMEPVIPSGSDSSAPSSACSALSPGVAPAGVVLIAATSPEPGRSGSGTGRPSSASSEPSAAAG